MFFFVFFLFFFFLGGGGSWHVGNNSNFNLMSEGKSSQNSSIKKCRLTKLLKFVCILNAPH